jgi:hypothetical protein
MKELGFPLTISPSTGSLEKQSGFMLMRLRREETGVEFDVFNDRADIEGLTRDLAGDIDPRFDRSANFRSGGDENEMVCGLCAAAALARLVNGVVLEDGEPLSVEQAIAWAKKHLHDVAPPAKPGGTRPADIKRYLKALLKERSDLALVGRLLVIKPVRHILRGVLFDRTGDKHCFRIWPYLQDLCHAYGEHGVGYLSYIHDSQWDVRKPYFEPLLMDALAQDVFEHVGKLATFGDLAVELSWKSQFQHQHFTALVLAGEHARAEEFIRESDDAGSSEWAENQRNYLRDIDTVCAKLHAREAKAVRELKLENIWEPSPFPVEVAAAERERRTAEPSFASTPWIARPEWLLQDLPEQPGDVRFARERLFRRGRVLLVASLNRAEAEDRHRNVEPYVLAARLTDGVGVWLRWDGFDRDHPFHGYRHGFRIGLVGESFTSQADFQRSNRREGMLELSAVEIFESATRQSVWLWSVGSRESWEMIRDYRPGGKRSPRRELNNAELDQLICPWPRFGEYEELVTLVRKGLQSRGYGEIT